MKWFLKVSLLAVVCALIPAQIACAAVDRNDVIDRLGNVVNRADAYRYDTKDNTGRNLETLDVIIRPNSFVGDQNRYLGVSHVLENGVFNVYLTRSTDLVNWTNIKMIAANGSNPTLKSLANGGFLLAYESNAAPGNHVQLREYASFATLKTGTAVRIADMPRTLSTYAEGTPDIRAINWNTTVNNSTITVGFHYYDGGVVDREAVGTYANGSWTTSARTGFDSQLTGLISPMMATTNTIGNYGDRSMFQAGGRDYEIVEGQLTKDDWGSWRVFLRDVADGQVVQVPMNTHYGQTSFGNPAVAVLPAPDGVGTVLFETMFLFTDGAPNGAGQMVAYSRLL